MCILDICIWHLLNEECGVLCTSKNYGACSHIENGRNKKVMNKPVTLNAVKTVISILTVTAILWHLISCLAIIIQERLTAARVAGHRCFW